MSEEFISELKDLFNKIEELRSNHEQFGKKLDLVLQVFSILKENFKFFSSPRFHNLLQVVIKQCDSLLVEAEVVYNRLNSEKRLSPDTKRSYRQLFATLPPLKAEVQRVLLNVETSVKKMETKVTPVQHLRRSNRLSKV